MLNVIKMELDYTRQSSSQVPVADEGKGDCATKEASCLHKITTNSA